jgi:hypothetical protein
MSNIIHLITSYLNAQKNYLDVKPQVSESKNKYTCITCTYIGLHIEICVYNDTFIKLKIDNMPYAICDGIKTLREEFDKIQYRY